MEGERIRYILTHLSKKNCCEVVESYPLVDISGQRSSSTTIELILKKPHTL